MSSVEWVKNWRHFLLFVDQSTPGYARICTETLSQSN